MTRFLEEGDRVKVMIQFRGREQQHIDLGASWMQRWYKKITPLHLPTHLVKITDTTQATSCWGRWAGT